MNTGARRALLVVALTFFLFLPIPGFQILFGTTAAYFAACILWGGLVGWYTPDVVRKWW